LPLPSALPRNKRWRGGLDRLPAHALGAAGRGRAVHPAAGDRPGNGDACAGYSRARPRSEP